MRSRRAATRAASMASPSLVACPSGLAEMRSRSRQVAGIAAPQQHIGEIAMRMRQGREGADARVQGQRFGEVPLRVLPAAFDRRQHAEETVARAPESGPAAHDDVSAFPGRQQSIQHRGVGPVVERDANLGQIHDAGRPSAVAGQRGEIVPRRGRRTRRAPRRDRRLRHTAAPVRAARSAPRRSGARTSQRSARDPAAGPAPAAA